MKMIPPMRKMSMTQRNEKTSDRKMAAVDHPPKNKKELRH